MCFQSVFLNLMRLTHDLEESLERTIDSLSHCSVKEMRRSVTTMKLGTRRWLYLRCWLRGLSWTLVDEPAETFHLRSANQASGSVYPNGKQKVNPLPILAPQFCRQSPHYETVGGYAWLAFAVSSKQAGIEDSTFMLKAWAALMYSQQNKIPCQMKK